MSDSSVDCSLVFAASFQARSSVNQSCPLATVMCRVRENHSFNPVMSLWTKLIVSSSLFPVGICPLFVCLFQWSHGIFFSIPSSRIRKKTICRTVHKPDTVPNAVAYGVARANSAPETTTHPRHIKNLNTLQLAKWRMSGLPKHQTLYAPAAMCEIYRTLYCEPNDSDT